jgi:hypothetical protein
VRSAKSGANAPRAWSADTNLPFAEALIQIVCPTGGAADATIAVITVISVKNMIFTVRDMHRLLKQLALCMAILLF